MNTKIRERLASVAEKFDTLEVALFCTFNFNADFFEQNVLPALFGVEPGSTRANRTQAVHRELVSTRVGVFFDPSQQRPSRKPYRYCAYPVFVRGGLFHPKNIVLIGTMKDGTRWVYVASMSANLSLKAWGSNCEGLADTWIHARTEQPCQSLAAFLDWLNERVGRQVEDDPLQRARVLLGQLHGRRGRTDPEGGHYDDKGNVSLYFSPLQRSMWDHVTRHYGAIRKLHAASPYWGEVAQTAHALRNVPVKLTASRVPPHYAAVVLGRDVTEPLSAAGCRPEVSTWERDGGRFHHLKLYEFQTVAGKITGVGSCNFTRRGLFWNSGEEGDVGNVESMLFDAVRVAWPPTVPLTEEELPQTSESDEPQPLPFYVFMTYDWRRHRFEWTLEGNVGKGVAAELLIDGQAPIVVSDAAPRGHRIGALKSRVFRLRLDSLHLDGVVTELNLGESTETYSKPLGTDSIIESWRAGAINEPSPPDGDGDDDDPPDPEQTNGVSIDSRKDAAPFFDSFSFFQALRVLHVKLLEASDDPRRLREWLIGRSDSVGAFVDAVCVSKSKAAARLIMCVECEALLKSLPFRPPETRAVLRKLAAECRRLRGEVRVEIGAELRSRDVRHDPEQLLDWYLKHFGKRIPVQGPDLALASGE